MVQGISGRGRWGQGGAHVTWCCMIACCMLLQPRWRPHELCSPYSRDQCAHPLAKRMAFTTVSTKEATWQQKTWSPQAPSAMLPRDGAQLLWPGAVQCTICCRSAWVDRPVPVPGCCSHTPPHSTWRQVLLTPELAILLVVASCCAAPTAAWCTEGWDGSDGESRQHRQAVGGWWGAYPFKWSGHDGGNGTRGTRAGRGARRCWE